VTSIHNAYRARHGLRFWNDTAFALAFVDDFENRIVQRNARISKLIQTGCFIRVEERGKLGGDVNLGRKHIACSFVFVDSGNFVASESKLDHAA